MNLAELIQAAREEARDLAAPYLWTDAELTRHANQAEREAARRARLLLDTLTDVDAAATPAPVCLYPLTVGQSVVSLHPSVVFVRRAKLGSKDAPLPKLARRDLDAHRPGWEAQDADEVIGYCSDYQEGKLVLYTASPAVDTLRLTVVRLPLVSMADPTQDSPEIAAHHHDGLVNWMLHRMYLKATAETFDKAASDQRLAMFEQEFGPRSSALDEQWIDEHHGYDDFEGLF